MPDFTTGPTLLPDVGTLKYNGCTFGPLFETKVSGNAVKDNAKRTVKYIEYTIVVDGYVTLPDGAGNISATMATLYALLTAQAGQLIYKGRAHDIVVNNGDLAWGPVPEMLEFQPLGGGLSAKISWKVTTRLEPPSVASAGRGVAANFGPRVGTLGIIQLNYETSVTYNEDGYSSLSIKGTIEGPPMSRSPTQKTRTVDVTVDTFRPFLEDRILKGIDLGRFRVTKRNFNISRDKRTMEWDFEAEEKPYMDLPPDCTIARGTYNVRPAKAGPGLVLWLCTLRATYTVRADKPRHYAWWAFLALLRLRMQQAELTPLPGDDEGEKPPTPFELLQTLAPGGADAINLKRQLEALKRKQNLGRRAWLIDFSLDEGLYLDSKTTSFSATWRLTSRFSHILLSSGLWKKLPDGGTAPDKNLWAMSMKDVMGSKSWLPNKLDPSLDVIVDMGSTEV